MRKKLRVSSESIRHLTEVQLSNVAGGLPESGPGKPCWPDPPPRLDDDERKKTKLGCWPDQT